MANTRGGKHKHLKKVGNQNKRELVLKSPNQEYAQVEKPLGNNLIRCKLFNNKFIVARIRGAMQKWAWINKNDIVLIQKYDEIATEEDKGAIIHVYFSDEIRKLQKSGELPMDLEIVEKSDEQKQNLEIMFNKDDDIKEEEETENDKIVKKYKMQDFLPNSDDSFDDSYDEKNKLKKTSSNQNISQISDQQSSESESYEKDELADI